MNKRATPCLYFSKKGKGFLMRGYQKKVIYVKNTGSRHFEEAYFVMRPDGEAPVSPDSMIDEANRIIRENFDVGRQSILYSKRWHILAFFIGCAVTFLICLITGLLM